MIFIISMHIGKMTHCLFGFTHIRERVCYPAVLPFAKSLGVSYIPLQKHESYLPVFHTRVMKCHLFYHLLIAFQTFSAGIYRKIFMVPSHFKWVTQPYCSPACR